MFSCKFATYFQNIFSQEHLWRAAYVFWWFALENKTEPAVISSTGFFFDNNLTNDASLTNKKLTLRIAEKKSADELNILGGIRFK